MSGKESIRVLVIDDDDLVLATISKMLQADTFSVDVSFSAREALSRLPETRYDAILCDMWMPGMTGKDFYNQVEKEFPEYQSRIVLLTGDIASEATWDFIEEKRLPYVLKPVSHPDLRRKLREVMGEGAKAAPKKGAEQRRHRRLSMRANLRVRKKKWAAGGPEITVVGNVSKEGLYFLTGRQYGVGTDVLVSFPYTGQGDIEQEGCVVRVDERSDGRRGVAIALGEAAAAARPTLEISPEERKRQRVLALADMTAEAPTRPSVVEQTAEVSDLKLQLDRERKEARRLTEEVADLKVSYERAASERDRLASEASDHDFRVRELTSTRDVMSRLSEELKHRVQDLQEKLAASERESATQAAAPARASEEAATIAELGRQLDQERNAARRQAQEMAELKAAYDRLTGERDRLAIRESDRNLQLGELTSTRDAMSRGIEELKQQVQDLQEKLAASERRQAQQAERAREAQQETAKAADLKKELDQEREATRRLTQELADLKGAYERATQERERLASQESDRNLQLRELTSTQDTMNRLVGEFRKKAHGLQTHVAGVESERDRAQKEVGAARDEAEKWRAESHRQQQAAASSERATRGQASTVKEPKGEVARLREDLKGLRAHIQEFQGGSVGPLTNLAANCDLLAMNKSLDAATRKSAKEMSQQAAQLRKAFQKLTRKS